MFSLTSNPASYSINSYYLVLSPGSLNPCWNGGGCSHLCEVHGDKSVCACPEGMKLEGEFKCINATVECPDYQFACSNGLCVPEAHVCDRLDHCGDGSDELLALCGMHFIMRLGSYSVKLPFYNKC